MDLTTLTGALTGLATAAAILIASLGRRRDTRADQWRAVLAERNELQAKYDGLRRRYDRLLDWAYDLRAALHKQNIDVPDLPRDDDDR